MLTNIQYAAAFSFSLGFGLIMFLAFMGRFLRRAQAKAEAAELLEEAQEKARDIEEARKQKVQNFTDEILERAEQDNKRVEQRIEKLESKIEEDESRWEDKLRHHEKSVSQLQSEVDIFDNKVRGVEKRVEQKRQTEQNLLASLREKLSQKTELIPADVTKSIQIKALENKKIEVTKSMQTWEEEWHTQVETEAKKLLSLTINRFARPYCPERGIGYLNFENEEQKNRVLGLEQKNLRLVEKLCGVDLAYDENNQAVNVFGFDPVRRELARASVDKMMRERQLDDSRIEQIVTKCKKELFQKIMTDGDRVAKELRVEKLHPEVKNMMGALRYRYSFTQNQYFHCAEVGFLCGLLASELDVPIREARRAGLLHDIGKSMDHSIDGGHAVIGADFIKQHGEEDSIVHAVRAHHFDEQPSTELAYLVIAADAISGARPGARRSTVATYTQKIQDLQTIARGFDGVVDTHVLSAGREVRVYVDGRQIDDLKALDMSRNIAQKIEEEMQYPGQIRVTVVRETQAVEYAR